MTDLKDKESSELKEDRGNVDKVSIVPEGILKVERLNKDTGEWDLEFEEKNLVLSGATSILRDIMFGDAQQITKMYFGNMNLTIGDNLVNVAPPEFSNIALINKQFEKVITKTKIVYTGSPAIQYQVTLLETEFNGTGTQLITEYGLANNSAKLFSRKTRAAIYKDIESTLKFTWIIVFT